MKNKSTILFWTDAALLLLFAALASTGVILRWVLPPGSGGGRAGSHGGELLLDMTRHEWGDWHFWIALTMVALVLLHFALHWGWIKTSTLRKLDILQRHDDPRWRQVNTDRHTAATSSNARS